MSENGIGEQSFKEKPDISMVFIRQIDRTNHAATKGHEGLSQAGVNQILVTLPAASRQWVYEQKDRYEIDRPTLIYKKFSGIRQGSEHDPVVWNEEKTDTGLSSEIGFEVDRDEEGEVDWDDHRIISPTRHDKAHTLQQKFNEVVMEAAEYAGLTWQSELTLVDGGDTLEWIERKKTPYRIPDHLRDLRKDDESPRTSS